jgi:hypothetical protein
MKSNLPKVFLTLFILFWSQLVAAQFISRDVVANAAETYTTPNLNLTITVGEPYGELLANPGVNLFLTTGFAQPDIDVQTLLSATVPDALLIYPNPTAGGVVKLAFNHVPDGVYTVSVIDASGKILQSQEVSYTLGSFAYLPIDVSRLAGGVYFVRVVNRVNFQGQIKLIKI